MMPRISSLLGRRNTSEADKMLQQKLRRVFFFLDDNMCGMISPKTALFALYRMQLVTRTGDKGLLRDIRAKVRRKTRNTEGALILADMVGPPREEGGLVGSAGDDGSLVCRAPNSQYDPSLPGAAGNDDSMPSMAKRLFTANMNLQHRSNDEHSVAMAPTGSLGSGTSGSSDIVTYEDFRRLILEDDEMASKLRAVCQKEARKSPTSKHLGMRNSEKIAVDVALGVLTLLLMLALIDQVAQYSMSTSEDFKLAHLENVVRLFFGNQTTDDEIPRLVKDEVMEYRGTQDWDLIYLDINRKVYCNALRATSPACKLPPDSDLTMYWGYRSSLDDIEADWQASAYRIDDLTVLYTETNSSATELNWERPSVLVYHDHATVEFEAVIALGTTIAVILIIFGGIFFIMKDLSILSTSLMKPLKELADDMSSLAHLNITGTRRSHPTEDRITEVRLLRKTFENMKMAITSWGKYVPWPVVSLLLRSNPDAQLDVKETEVSMFFSDIASFTTIVESIPPTSCLELLGRYFNDMTTVIDSYNGVVLEFIGDAILCIYGAPISDPEHATKAVRASLGMLHSLISLNTWGSSKGLPQVDIRCGVHTGTVLVGNMGMHSRMKYGIVGADASIPSFLEETNKTYTTNLLISKSTHSRLDPNAFIMRPIDVLRMTPGALEPEQIYQVMDRCRRSGGNQLLPVASLHTAAMAHYNARDFEEAYCAFERVHHMMQHVHGIDDIPSALLMSRCMSYLEVPPPADWNGVWDCGG
eukprot:NODE_436_length_3053_cov_33.945318.p1 GENE.NODE_436_length_3053_cov_33.945318~~NODE_436_length_3053_cov_33.945318.p1  ORF type:complete len:804 (-),score=181.12 NODE_436_length_3053_cov_33.945318:640-2910(-)